MKRRPSPQGFTLVEILVIVGIIALLVTLALPNLQRAKLAANESSAKATLKTISTSLENYAVLNSIYPTATSLLIGASPPYLSVDYFSGPHNGYSFTSVLADYSYTITATPVNSNTGTQSFMITTGGVLTP